MEEVEERLFHVFFYDEEAMERVLRGGPWYTKILLLQQWRIDCNPGKLAFDHILQMRCKLRAYMGEALDVGLYEIIATQGVIVKILVQLDITKQLRKGVIAGSWSNGVF